ncbi:DUF4430 domain-containing protein [Streptomyces sp. NPDC005805]|uniref:DUF4430 domain-containing protein n=1 Tax=Streptomyces sp. NPDC005805 TaxID=3157068 RepID=UPI0033E9C894
MHRTTVHRALVTATALGLALTTAPAAAQAVPASASAHIAAHHTSHANTNAPVKVRLTVQGPDGLLFKGRVRTKGHDVTTATGGTRKCDGTNGGAHATKVPTPTAALDDAARRHGFTWDGTWYASFDDFSVDTVKGVSGGGSAYWNISVNGTPTPVGGCQFRLKAGDRVAFTWTSF